MQSLVEQISQAGEMEIADIFEASWRRYSALFPDWEITTISLQKASNRNEQIDRVIAVLEAMKTSL